MKQENSSPPPLLEPGELRRIVMLFLTALAALAGLAGPLWVIVRQYQARRMVEGLLGVGWETAGLLLIIGLLLWCALWLGVIVGLATARD